MVKYLVIVESPAKIKKIQAILDTVPGHSFMVEASYGHIRYFKNGLKSIDIENNFKPTYSITADKIKVVKKLQKVSKLVDEIIIATDNDREGEAIGYHLIKVLKKSVSTTKRIYFNEITKPAILEAFHNPQTLNMNEFNAQQARSVLDLLIGFKISPLLWKHIKVKLSAGRCQTPALRLVYEREGLIQNFIPKGSYEVLGYFKFKTLDLETKYFKNLKNEQIAKINLERLIDLDYTLQLASKKSSENRPPAPFITSTIQQEASNKFNISPKNTMSILQKLYEGGKITYMRTDSPIISKEFVKLCKDFVNSNYGNKFVERTYKAKTKDAQEAHECIRPVLLTITPDDIGDSFARKLYSLIWKRTIACFLPNYIEEHSIFRLYPNDTEYFETTKKIVLQKGFKVLYSDNLPDDSDDIALLNSLGKTTTNITNIVAKEKYTKPKALYTEASLVKDLEGRGIGRPSTFSNIVNTLLTRKYVVKESRDMPSIKLKEFSIKPGCVLIENEKIQKQGKSKNKLYITQLGKNVMNYLCEHFDANLCSYTFTSDINNELDKIADNSETWYDVVKFVYDIFIEKVKEQSKITKVKQDVNKILVATDSESDYTYYYYTDNYGTVFLREQGDESEKRRVKENIPTTDINMKIIKEYFAFPIKKGKYLDDEVLIKKGPYGIYCEIGKIRFSVENSDISLEKIIEKLKEKNKKIIKEWKDISILNGPYGPYIRYGKKNVSIGGDVDPKNLNRKQCLEIVKTYKPKPKYKKKAFKK